MDYGDEISNEIRSYNFSTVYPDTIFYKYHLNSISEFFSELQKQYEEKIEKYKQIQDDEI